MLFGAAFEAVGPVLEVLFLLALGVGLVLWIGESVGKVVLQRKPELVNRLILCGIPINDFLPGNEKHYEVLKDFPAEHVLCIQNREDNHGSFAKVEKFVRALNPIIQILPKERQDHEYPYPEDILNFLSVK